MEEAMYTKTGYPKLIIDLGKLRSNIEYTTAKCAEIGVDVAGVIKGFTGLIPCAKQFDEGGCKWIASSRLEQLAPLKEAGITKPLMMIRIPSFSEVEDVISICDYSLNSEVEVLKALNEEAGKQGKLHKVVIMADCGDLREGFWDKDEMVEVAVEVENKMDNLVLAGVGVNVGCYGSIIATPEKLQELVDIAERIEEKIGHELEIISGGATSSFMRVIDGNLPERINMLRIGEGIILSYDYKALYNYPTEELVTDAFTLQAQVIEVKDKPSHPVGEIGFDAFGHRIEYDDRGIRRRALLGLGKVDYGDPEELLVREKGVEVLGASSDHTILDIEDAERDIKVGDIIEIDIKYATLVYVTSTDNIEKVYI